MHGVKHISIFAENKPGKIASITRVLADGMINILGMTIASSESFGVIKFLVDDCEKAYQMLKEKGFTVSVNDILAVEMADKPGGLSEIAQILSDHGINIEYAYGLPIEPLKRAFLIAEVNDIDRARRLLKNESLRFLSEEDIRKERTK
ncbi:MAG: ACT domain-containing protein [Dissulfurispiraceae bacterium]